MKTILIAVAVVLVLLAVSFAGCAISYTNEEARLRNLITAKQKDNTSEFDAMWKTIAQTAQVAEKDRSSLEGLFVAHAQARTGSGGGGELMKWVQESVPQVDASTMKNLQNIIVGSRDRFAERQKEILDFSRVHNNLIDTQPSGLFLSMFGRTDRIDVKIVTSSRTDAAFFSGKDDDVKVFESKEKK